MSAQIVTANRLRDGVVVYLAEDGGWTEHIDAARVAEDAEFAGELLAAAQESQHAGAVVDAYLIALGEGGEPLGCREQIRSRGPSVRLDLGKQAYGS